MNIRRVGIGLALFAAAGSAFAHPGHGGGSFLAGFGHPLGGADHLLAMLAVGVYAARQPGRSGLALVFAFALAMAAGAALGTTAVGVPLAELGVASSVMVLGLLIAVAQRLPLVIAMPLVAVFALCHGQAHQAELGEAAMLPYAAGFLAACGLLQALGLLLGRWLPERGGLRLLKRALGVALAGFGLVLMGS